MYSSTFYVHYNRIRSGLSHDLALLFDKIIVSYSSRADVCVLIDSDFQQIRSAVGKLFSNVLSSALLEFYSVIFFSQPVLPEIGLCSYSGTSAGLSFSSPLARTERNLVLACYDVLEFPIRIGIPLIDSWIRLCYLILDDDVDQFLLPILLKRVYNFIPVVKKWLKFESSTRYIVRLGGTSINYYSLYLDSLVFRITQLFTLKPATTFPVCLLELNGLPGVGKTTLASVISIAVSNFFMIESFGQLYCRPDEKFWNGYEQQLVVIYDDMNQSKHINFNLGKELIDVGSGSFNSVPMASVEEKGTSFTSVLVVLTSNTLLKSTLDVVPGALSRRMKTAVMTRNPHVSLNACDGSYVSDSFSDIDSLLLRILSRFLVRVHSLMGSECLLPDFNLEVDTSDLFVEPKKRIRVAYDSKLSIKKVLDFDYLPVDGSDIFHVPSDFKIERKKYGPPVVYDDLGIRILTRASEFGFIPPTITSEVLSILFACGTGLGIILVRLLS